MGEVVRLNRRNQPGDSLAASLRTLRSLTRKNPGEFAAAIADEAGEPLPASVYMAYEEGELAPASIMSAARRVVVRAKTEAPTVPSGSGEFRTGAFEGTASCGQVVPGLGDEDGDEVRRRDFLALTAATITALDAPGKFSRLATGRMDAETCEGLSNLVLGYRQVYRSASPVSLLDPVRGTLNLLTELAPDSGPYHTTVISLIGQTANLAGAILMFDLDDFTTAKQYLTIGARAAQQSADGELMAITLACRAFHAAYSGDPQAGVAFAQGALDAAARGIHPRSHGWVAAVASEMHATLGPTGETDCMASLETASVQLARPMPEQPWAGIGAFDEGKLAAYRGGDLMRLGDYAGAQVELQTALEQLSPALVKHRCTAHIDLAEAFARDNEPEQAAGHAASALEIISATRHADSLRRVEHIYAKVRGSGMAQARDLGSRILEFKATS
jgi:hypothetical protein